MKKNTLTAIGPNGATATRTTHRTYTHVVFVRAITEEAWRESVRQRMEYTRRVIAEYTASLAEMDARQPEGGLMNQAYYRKEIPVREAILVQYEATLAAGYDKSWGAYTWCGRYDLAVQQADKARKTGYGLQVRIAEVVAK